MMIAKKRILACAAALLFAASADAQARITCDISSAAGKPLPPKADVANPGGFQIFWEIATQLEDVADAAGDPAAMADLQAARKLTDGYYINALFAGPLIYWPNRPQECVLNFKRIGPDDSIEVDGETYTFEDGGMAGRDKCMRDQTEFLDTLSDEKDMARDVQSAALRRVFSNLDLKGEQARGKGIWGTTLIRNQEFSYDQSTDKMSITQLPDSYCAAAANDIILDGQMVYQEPHIQLQTKKYLQIPRLSSNGRLVFSKNPAADSIPENARAYGLIAEAFEEAKLPVADFRANIRRWNPQRSPKLFTELANDPIIEGFNFEGGSRLLTDQPRFMDNYVEGMAWVIANTDRNISLLMPGYWEREDVGNNEEIDGLIPRVRETLLTLNTKLGAKLNLPKGQNAICSSRFTFIVASYGQPVHVKTLPMRRDGRLAGTITGQIKLLSEIRKDLCGV